MAKNSQVESAGLNAIPIEERKSGAIPNFV